MLARRQTSAYDTRFSQAYAFKAFFIVAFMTLLFSVVPTEQARAVQGCPLSGPAGSDIGDPIGGAQATGQQGDVEAAVLAQIQNEDSSVTDVTRVVKFEGWPSGTEDCKTKNGITAQSFVTGDQANTGVWVSDVAICAVLTKAGSGEGELFYYDPAQFSGDWEVTDTLGGKDISNLSFFTCQREQAPTGTIKLVKAIPDDQGTNNDFTFTSTVPAFDNTTLTPTDDNNGFLTDSVNSGDLATGVSYTITEQDNPDFDLTSIVCELDGGGTPTSNSSDSGNTVSIDLEAEDLVCTFTNEPIQVAPSEITLTKETTDGLTADFEFTSQEIAAFNTTLTTNGGSDSEGPVEVTGGQAFSITEVDNPDYNLQHASCVPVGGGSAGGTLSGNTLTFRPDAGTDYNCTFTNASKKEGNIIVKKVVDPSDSTETFEFTTDFSSPFSLGHNDTRTFSVALDETYVITESPDDSFELASIDCQVKSGEVTFDKTVDNGEVSITFPADAPTDASIECVYTNKRETGIIEVVKKAIGGNDDFSFLLEGPEDGSFGLRGGEKKVFSDISAGEYTITETSLPEGWTLKNVRCGQGVRTENGFEITLDKGESITCTFTNFKEDDEDMEEEVEKFNEVVLDHLLSHEPDRARLIRRLDHSQPVSLKDTGSLPPLKITGSMMSGGSPITGSPAASGNSTTAGGMTGGFSMSLSGLRASMMAEDAKKIREAQEGDGVKSSFSSDPYIAPYMMTRPGWDLWIEGQVTRYSDDEGGRDRNGLFSILYVGADYAVAPGMIVGALVQVDHTDHDIKSDDVWGNIEGTGWMAGPYMGAKISDNLTFDARAAWGQSSNDVELDSDDSDYRTGEFDMERWLVSAKLTGLYHHGGWRISPHVGVIWGNQDQDAFKNSLGQNVGSSSVSLGRVTFGPEFGYTKTLSDGSTIEPHVSIEGIWQFDGHEMQFGDETVKTDDLRAKVEGGVNYATPGGYKFRAAGSYDGLGDDDFEAWSAKAWVNIPLN